MTCPIAPALRTIPADLRSAKPAGLGARQKAARTGHEGEPLYRALRASPRGTRRAPRTRPHSWSGPGGRSARRPPLAAPSGVDLRLQPSAGTRRPGDLPAAGVTGPGPSARQARPQRRASGPAIPGRVARPTVRALQARRSSSPEDTARSVICRSTRLRAWSSATSPIPSAASRPAAGTNSRVSRRDRRCRRWPAGRKEQPGRFR